MSGTLSSTPIKHKKSKLREYDLEGESAFINLVLDCINRREIPTLDPIIRSRVLEKSETKKGLLGLTLRYLTDIKYLNEADASAFLLATATQPQLERLFFQSLNQWSLDPPTRVTVQKLTEDLKFYASCLNSVNELGETPLMVAVKSKHENLVQALLETSGINLSIQDEQGNTALHWAAIKGDAFIARIIIGHVREKCPALETSPGNRGYTPLMLAVFKANPALVPAPGTEHWGMAIAECLLSKKPPHDLTDLARLLKQLYDRPDKTSFDRMIKTLSEIEAINPGGPLASQWKAAIDQFFGRAEEYPTLSTDIEHLEKEHKQLLVLSGTVTSETQALRLLEEDNSKLAAEIAIVDAQINTIQEELSAFCEAPQKKLERDEAWQKEMGVLNIEKDRMAQEHRLATTQCSEVSAAITAYQAQSQELRAQIEELNREIHALTTAMGAPLIRSSTPIAAVLMGGSGAGCGPSASDESLKK